MTYVRGRFYDLSCKPVLRAPAVHGVSSYDCVVKHLKSTSIVAAEPHYDGEIVTGLSK